MKKILFSFLIMFNLLLHADEYPSLHNGTFLNDILNSANFNSGNDFVKNYTSSITKHSRKSVSSGLPYYPEGWNKFKVYVPAGTRLSMTFATYPNTTARIHMTWNGSTGGVNHYNPYGATPTTTSTASTIMTNTTSLFLFSDNSSGWLYFDIVEDSANSYAEQGYQSSASLYIGYNIKKVNNDLFNSWLMSTYFLTAMGDPSASVPAINVIDVSTENTPSQRTATLSYGGALYDGTPISSSSFSSVQTSSIASIGSSASSVFSSYSSSIISGGSCSSGYYQDPDTGGCIPIGGVTSSSVSSRSSSSSYFSSSGTCTGGFLPGPGETAIICSSSSSNSLSSSASSINTGSCSSGYYQDQDTGGCIPLSSSSSSSSSLDANTTTASINLQKGWNLISLPIEIKGTIDLNSTMSNLEIYKALQFKYITDANQTDEWILWTPGSAGTLSSTQGMFVGITAQTPPSITFTVKKDTNATKFSDLTFIENRWYVLGFGYNLSIADIKTKCTNSAIWTLDTNGAYKREDDNSTIIEKGHGFWYKCYDTNSSI